MRVKQVHEQHTCSARGGGYTIRTRFACSVLLLPLATRFARFACSVLLRPLATLFARFACSGQRCSAALLRDTHTNTSHRCLFFISKDNRRVAPPLAVVRPVGGGGGISPRNFFEIRMHNPEFWALLALFYYGGRTWSGEKVVRSGCYAPV